MVKIIQAGAVNHRRERSAAVPPPIGQPAAKPAPGLGDRIEKLVKPAAKLLQRAGLINCLDADGRLRPNTPCQRRRDRLNRASATRPK